MKVKIMYTVDKNEVKDKISELVESVIKPMQTQFNLLLSVSSSLKEETMTTGASTELIDSVRQQLSLIDQRLSEVYVMMGQYHNMENPPPSPEPTAMADQVPQQQAQQQAQQQQNFTATGDWQQQLAANLQGQNPLSSAQMKQYLELMQESLKLQRDTTESIKRGK